MGPLKFVSNVSRFKPALNLNRVLADLNRGLNSLNSISDFLEIKKHYFLNSFHLNPIKLNSTPHPHIYIKIPAPSIFPEKRKVFTIFTPCGSIQSLVLVYYTIIQYIADNRSFFSFSDIYMFILYLDIYIHDFKLFSFCSKSFSKLFFSAKFKAEDKI